ncbi:MAG: Gfo/Idh/MocA family oxidoreductase [Candidatus Magasanikbacteria bacterium]|nr:Gfo/Idh/MocA family oxidoreductase [Candidatus Magasanikbacteria bacterium]
MIGKYAVALVGAGGIGKRWVKALSSMGEVNLLAVLDTDGDKARELAGVYGPACQAYTDYEELLKRTDIDIVIAATPHKYLASISRAALSAGKHVMSEKPCAVSSTELFDLLNFAQARNLRYMAGFNHRFHEGFLLARKLFTEGKIGDIQFIRAVYGFGARKGMNTEWRMNKEWAGGGELIDQGVHMVDMVISFFGEIAEVKGFVENLHWTAQVEDNAFLLLKSKKKQLASIHVSWSNWKPLHRFEIYGSFGYIHVEGLGRKYGGTEKVIFGIRDETYSALPREEIFECNPDAELSFVREMRELLLAIEEGRDPVPSGKDALSVLKIVEQIYEG